MGFAKRRVQINAEACGETLAKQTVRQLYNGLQQNAIDVSFASDTRKGLESFSYTQATD